MTTANDPRWARLDALVKAALRWAAAAARVRGDDTNPALDSFDLLIGILLADLRGSPARQLLEHFHIPLGAVLRVDGNRPLPPNALIAALKRVPTGEIPPLTPGTELVIGKLLSDPPADPDGLISLRTLFGELLADGGQPVTAAIRGLLTSQGVDPTRITSTYADYLHSRLSYAEFLRARHPHQPRAVALPTYLPDQPHRRTATTDELPDLVGIGPEIDAFAYLIASDRLVPPLAIGLFGDWGSGKSYFLRGVQRRIDTIAAEVDAARQQDHEPPPPFHSRIVQIEFNAWQYVEGDLWASLVEHLFRNLRVGDDGDDLLGAEQRYWIEQLHHAGSAQQDALRERDRLEELHRRAEAEVTLRRLDRDKAVAELERQRARHPLRGWRPSLELVTKAHKAAALAGMTSAAEQGEQLSAELEQARTAIEKANPILAPLRAKGWRYLAIIVPLLVVLLAAVLAIEVFHLSAVAAFGTWAMSAVAAAVGYLRLANRFVTAATATISGVQEELDAADRERRDELDEGVRTAEETLVQVEQELGTAVENEKQRAVEVAMARAELARTTPRRVLTEFITDRLGSDDYRRHLGMPALVRRDLERLSRLVAAQQERSAGPPAEGEYAIDRIVLYIDDLDRCPTEVVIKVLEAVHLLLAFPLFVVVVAVDSRWLASSLRTHYAQLGGDNAAPEDYLEKIFQVPFVVRPLAVEVRQQMLRGLLAANVAGQTGAPAEGNEVTEDVPPGDLAEFRQVVSSLAITGQSTPAWLAATSLTITTPELRFVEDAAELVGRTPRAVKRYVNIYLLAKSMGLSRGLVIPCDGQLALLVAVVTGQPDLADTLLPALAKDTRSPLRLGEVRPINTALSDWLDVRTERRGLDMSGLAGWVGLVGRFRFSSATS